MLRQTVASHTTTESSRVNFEDMEQLQSSMATPEGQAAPNDIPNFATGGATVFISEVDS